MLAHENPRLRYTVSLPDELQRIRNHQAHRQIPQRSDDKLLIATWNLTNFGLQKRQLKHLEIMAEILKPFDLVAIQEVADNLKHLNKLLSYLGKDWDVVFTDIAGNQERLGYLYRSDRVEPTGLAAELAMRGYERKKVTITVGDEESAEGDFEGFNRNPYMLSFKSGDFVFTVVNVHLYWSKFHLRKLETQALCKWAKKRIKKAYPPNNDIILIGDFNMPQLSDDDEIYKIITKNSFKLPAYNTELIGTNLDGTKHYDEVAFFRSRTGRDYTGKIGVFDFDKVLFPNLYNRDTQKFFKYIRYFIADHLPLWIEFFRHS